MKPEWTEWHESRIVLQEPPQCEEVFGTFLEYLYTGRILVTHTNVMAILTLADKYIVKVTINKVVFVPRLTCNITESNSPMHKIHVESCSSRCLPQPAILVAAIYCELWLQSRGGAMLQFHQMELPVSRQHPRFQQFRGRTPLRFVTTKRSDRLQ